MSLALDDDLDDDSDLLDHSLASGTQRSNFGTCNGCRQTLVYIAKRNRFGEELCQDCAMKCCYSCESYSPCPSVHGTRQYCSDCYNERFGDENDFDMESHPDNCRCEPCLWACDPGTQYDEYCFNEPCCEPMHACGWDGMQRQDSRDIRRSRRRRSIVIGAETKMHEFAIAGVRDSYVQTVYSHGLGSHNFGRKPRYKQPRRNVDTRTRPAVASTF